MRHKAERLPTGHVNQALIAFLVVVALVTFARVMYWATVFLMGWLLWS